MLKVCEACGAWLDDAVVEGDEAVCTACGHRRPFVRLPLFRLTGASGSGETTACRGLPDAELLGPAPLLRLRGKHRAQLVGKTDRPRALAARAAALLSAAAPAMRRAGIAVVVDVDPQQL